MVYFFVYPEFNSYFSIKNLIFVQLARIMTVTETIRNRALAASAKKKAHIVVCAMTKARVAGHVIFADRILWRVSVANNESGQISVKVGKYHC